MRTGADMQMTSGRSPRSMARFAGFVYLLVFITGMLALMNRGKLGVAAGLVAGVLYLVVTVLFYFLFKPVNKRLSLLAAVVSVVGIVAGSAQLSAVNPLVFFGVYCLLIGYLILRSTFLPRFLAGLMFFASAGWLTFASQRLTAYLSPYNFAPGIIGEGALTVWLLVAGVDPDRWLEQASADLPQNRSVVRGRAH